MLFYHSYYIYYRLNILLLYNRKYTRKTFPSRSTGEHILRLQFLCCAPQKGCRYNLFLLTMLNCTFPSSHTNKLITLTFKFQSHYNLTTAEQRAISTLLSDPTIGIRTTNKRSTMVVMNYSDPIRSPQTTF